MQDDLLEIPHDFKIYKDRAIFVGTFLGGPLVAGYLTAENFKKLEQPEKVWMAWGISILVTIAIFAGVFLVPAFAKVPRYIIPILYAGIAQWVVQKFQGDAIKSHIENGGPIYSVWRSVWIGALGSVVLVAIIFLIILLLGQQNL